MGLLSKMRKRRQEKKAAYKAAKLRAKAEAKADAKLEQRKDKYLRKTAKQVRKYDAKELKARRKHEEYMAKNALQQIKAGRFNKNNVARYATALRTAAPAALPLLYRAMVQIQENSEGSRASRSGVTRRSMAAFSGEGAPQRARIKAVRDAVKRGVPNGFAKDIDERLDTLEDAVRNAEAMPPSQQRRMLGSVSTELDLIESQIAEKSV
ncbi:DUF6474 family protein [Corynebacterium auriscanis]|uniref:DUF6474 family protein n=1 Tax=Corynebacterium auriscanis TaxID=99807 RepID=UPI003CEF8E9B